MTRAAIITVLLAFCATGLLAQKTPAGSVINDAPPKSFYLKLSPLAILASQVPGTGEMRLGLEMVASPKVTTQFSASYLFKSPVFSLLVQDTFNIFRYFEFPGYRFQGQVRYYFLKFNNKQQLSNVLTPSGMYISLHASYAQASLKPKNSGNLPRLDFSHVNISTILGAQVLYHNNVGADLFFGLGYKNNVIASFDSFGNKEFLSSSDFGALYAIPIKVTLGMNITFGVF